MRAGLDLARVHADGEVGDESVLGFAGLARRKDTVAPGLADADDCPGLIAAMGDNYSTIR